MILYRKRSIYIDNISKIDQFYIEIAIVDSIKIVKIPIDINRQSNLESEFDSRTTIWFGLPNRISLMPGHGRNMKDLIPVYYALKTYALQQSWNRSIQVLLYIKRSRLAELVRFSDVFSCNLRPGNGTWWSSTDAIKLGEIIWLKKKFKIFFDIHFWIGSNQVSRLVWITKK